MRGELTAGSQQGDDSEVESMALTSVNNFNLTFNEANTIADNANSSIFSVTPGSASTLSYWTNASVSTSAILNYTWIEDNLEPHDPSKWLDWSLGTVRSRAWA